MSVKPHDQVGGNCHD